MKLRKAGLRHLFQSLATRLVVLICRLKPFFPLTRHFVPTSPTEGRGKNANIKTSLASVFEKRITSPLGEKTITTALNVYEEFTSPPVGEVAAQQRVRGIS
ncbi:MAG TPA: hypothetical protein VMW10_08855 [Alphaproteobacteria bacterium]|nr:hypothetical protein [Alphaproteobacteria bacterium]